MASETRTSLYRLLRETARAYLDAREGEDSREETVKIRHEVDCLLALGQADEFCPVTAFNEYSAKTSKSGRMMVGG